MRILNYDTKRAYEHGLELKVALGIHPANALANNEIIFKQLEKWIENKDIIAIGKGEMEYIPPEESTTAASDEDAEGAEEESTTADAKGTTEATAEETTENA